MSSEESPWRDPDSPELHASLKQFAEWFPPEKFSAKAADERKKLSQKLAIKRKRRG